MSKSDISDFSRINLKDDADQIVQKIKKAKTDSIPEITLDPINRPEVSNLINIYSSLRGDSVEKIVNDYKGLNFSQFKADFTDLLISKLLPITNEYSKLLKDKVYINTILNKGTEQASLKAVVTLREIKELFGYVI